MTFLPPPTGRLARSRLRGRRDPSERAHSPAESMTATSGYWLLGGPGGVFTFHATYAGSVRT